MDQKIKNSSPQEPIGRSLSLLRLKRSVSRSPQLLVLLKEELARTLTADPPESSVDDSRIYLREQLNQGSSWQDISQFLWADFSKNPNTTKAVRLLETAFLEADAETGLDIFAKLLSLSNKSFYWQVHPKIRDFVVENIQDQAADILYWLLAKERNHDLLRGLEHLFIFLRVVSRSDKTAAWMYFKKHQRAMFSSFGGGTHFGMNAYQFAIRVGELALGQGYTEEAREVFALIPPNSEERKFALQLLMRFESPETSYKRSIYELHLERTQDWAQRLKAMEEFCVQCRRQEGLKDPNRGSLNLVFKKITAWIPKTQDSFKEASTLIWKNRDLLSVIPNLFQLFQDNALIFHNAELDTSLWETTLKNAANTKEERYIQSLAKFHLYVTSPKSGESNFWEASDSLQTPSSNLIFDQTSWHDLIRAAKQWLSQTPFITDKEKKRIESCLELFHHHTNASKEVIFNYLLNCGALPDLIQNAVVQRTLEAGNQLAAVEILTKSGFFRWFTNQDLNNIWDLAKSRRSPDLAWRTSTILATRDALSPSIRQTWEISGERRSVYSPQSLKSQDLECALQELPPAFRRFANALLHLGEQLNEFFQIQHPSGGLTSGQQAISHTEVGILKALKDTSFIPKSPKNLLEPTGVHSVPKDALPLVSTLQNNPWLFTLRSLSERLSIPSWNWNIQNFQHSLKTITHSTRRDVKNDAKIQKWLQNLSTQEKALWNDLANTSFGDPSDGGASYLIKFICRLSLMIYPAHFSALKTMHEINMPLAIIRDLEAFLLSEALTLFRERNRLSTQVTVPKSLKG